MNHRKWRHIALKRSHINRKWRHHDRKVSGSGGRWASMGKLLLVYKKACSLCTSSLATGLMTSLVIVAGSVLYWKFDHIRFLFYANFWLFQDRSHCGCISGHSNRWVWSWGEMNTICIVVDSTKLRLKCPEAWSSWKTDVFWQWQEWTLKTNKLIIRIFGCC